MLTDTHSISGDFEPYLREMGCLVINFNVAEHNARKIACALIDPTNDRVGHVVLDVARAPRIEEVVRALAGLRIDREQTRVETMPVRFRLRELLDKAGISQTEAGRLSGVSYATINRMCTNATAQVSLDVLDRLAKMLKVEPGDLLEREPKRRSTL